MRDRGAESGENAPGRATLAVACAEIGDAGPRADADAVRDGARLRTRVPRHDGRDRGAAADGGGPRARPHRPAVGRTSRTRSPCRPSTSIGGAIGDRVGLCDDVRRRGRPVRARLAAHGARAVGGRARSRGRALQGVGGAVLTTTSLALLRVTWAGQAGRAIGLWTSLTSLATVGGPPLGGVIVQTVSWRWVFAINVPLAAVTVALALAGRGEDERAQRPRDARPRRLGARGRRADGHQLRDRRGARARVRGGAAVPRRRRSPRSPASSSGRSARAIPWCRRRSCAFPGSRAANLVTLVMYAALGAHLLFLPVYLQFLGFSPTLAGLVFAPPSIGLILLAPRFGRYADRNGPRLPIAFGAATIGVGGAAAPARDRPGRTRGRGALASVCLFAIGLPAVVAPITAAALSPAPEDLAGVAAGTQSDGRARRRHPLGRRDRRARGRRVRRPRAARATRRSTRRRAGAVREAGVDAFHAVVICVASLAFLASALAAVVPPGPAVRGARPRA